VRRYRCQSHKTAAETRTATLTQMSQRLWGGPRVERSAVTVGAMPVLRTAVLEIACADHGDEAAPALVVVHGWPDAARGWTPVVDALVAANTTTSGYASTRSTT
jgi:hypothetical protein